jgi:hypothetical protein
VALAELDVVALEDRGAQVVLEADAVAGVEDEAGIVAGLPDTALSGNLCARPNRLK